MSAVSFERPCGVAPAVALHRLEAHLTQRGYQVSARSNTELHLLSTRAQPRHRLVVRSEGRALKFTFEASVDPGAPEVPLERALFEALVDEAATAVGGPAAVAGARTLVRCATCGTMGAAGATTCEVCGSRL